MRIPSNQNSVRWFELTHCSLLDSKLEFLFYEQCLPSQRITLILLNKYCCLVLNEYRSYRCRIYGNVCIHICTINSVECDLFL